MSDTSPEKSLRVLISGAGIGGLVAAYWLIKSGTSVTVLERAKDLRKEGHIVGLRKEALPIISYMGLDKEIQKHMSHEKGLKMVDSSHRTWASFLPGDLGFSCGVELRRGDLVNSIYAKVKNRAHFIFDRTIETMEETNEAIRVTLGGSPPRVLEFDVLLVAEGLRSRTRAKLFEEEVNAPISSLGLMAASFSCGSNDGWAYWYNIPDHRALLLRPDRLDRSRTLALCRTSEEYTGCTNLASSKTPTQKQKDFFIQRFKETGWEAKRLMEALDKDSDFYVLEMVQVKCPKWSKGRAVLLGDSAYCPSPFGGMGTTAAIVGAYSLAAELVQRPGDHRSAFEAYENSLKPWTESIQKPVEMTIQFGIPGSSFGILFFHIISSFLSLPLVTSLLPFLMPFLVKLGLPINGIAPPNPKPSIFN